MTLRAGRAGLIGLVAVVITAAAVVDSVVGRPAPSAAIPSAVITPAAAAGTAIAPAHVTSTAWYCVAGTSAGIAFANASTRAVSGEITFASGGPGRAVTVPAGGETTTPAPMARGTAAPLAATALLDGGGVGADVVTARRGGAWGATSCASETAPVWWFPQGATVIGSDLEVHVYNPTETDAVVDISAYTPSGVLEPPAWQTLEVAPGALVSERVAAHVADSPVVGLEVRAQTGSVVAEESDTTRIGDVVGQVEQLGAPALSTQWSFPLTSTPAAASTGHEASRRRRAATPPAGDVAFSVLNPSAVPAQMQLSVATTSGVFRPVEFAAAPGAVTVFDATSAGGLPLSAPYAASFRATNGVAVVVGRTITARRSGATPPTVGAVIGDPSGAWSWVVPQVPPPGGGPYELAVAATVAPARVSLTELGPGGARTPVRGALSIRVAAGGFIAFGPLPAPPIGRAVLLVQADAPVSVELDAAPAAGPGIVVVPAWPQPSG